LDLRRLLILLKKPIMRGALRYSVNGHSSRLTIFQPPTTSRVVAARSVFASGVFVMVCQFVAIIIYLFCAPAPQVLFTLDAPQPFVLVYQLALGRGGATFMAVLSTLSYVFVRTNLCMCCSRE
jgi:translation initiation factor 5B